MDKIEITAEELLSMDRRLIKLVDCRSIEEIAKSPKIDGATLGHTLASLTDSLASLDEPVVFYCRSGSRSKTAAQNLRQQNYLNVFSLKGGIDGFNANQVLGDDLCQRFHRQIILPQIGISGQIRLKRSHIAIIGLGGVGASAALYLSSAGIGQLTLVDGDSIEKSNLHRQIAYATDQIGEAKARILQNEIKRRAPSCQIEVFEEHFLKKNCIKILSKKTDLILDCTDNSEARILINSISRKLNIPWIHSAIYQQSAMIIPFFDPQRPGCYQCLFPEREPPSPKVGNCAEARRSLLESHQSLAIFKSGMRDDIDQKKRIVKESFEDMMDSFSWLTTTGKVSTHDLLDTKEEFSLKDLIEMTNARLRKFDSKLDELLYICTPSPDPFWVVRALVPFAENFILEPSRKGPTVRGILKKKGIQC